MEFCVCLFNELLFLAKFNRVRRSSGVVAQSDCECYLLHASILCLV